MPGDVHPLRKKSAPDLAHAPEAPPPTRAWWTSIVHEPFFQFIFIGFLLWSAVGYVHAQNGRYTVVIRAADRIRIADIYVQQFHQAPSPDQLQPLLDRYIREEIYVREAQALSLDKDDEIVRRRLVQKYDFLQTDLLSPAVPTPDELGRWFKANESHYAIPPRVAFTHIYFSADRRDEAAARQRALEALAQVQKSRKTRQLDLGDSFPGPVDIAGLEPEAAKRLFGQSELAEALFGIPLGQWAGPFRSGYGWHLVYVTSRSQSAVPLLADIRARVSNDYAQDQRRILRETAFEKLRAKYTIRFEDGGR